MLKSVMVKWIGIFASLALAVVGVVASAPAAEAYTPSNRVTFNNPKKKSQRYKLIYELDRAINATPVRGTITMAMYLFDRPTTARALINAHRRGVHVQVVLDNGADTKEVRNLTAELKVVRFRGDTSFIKRCANSCSSPVPASTMHAKFYLFSQSGSAKYVSMVSSANPHLVNSANSFNNNHTRVGDKKIYDALRSYFGYMRTGRDKNFGNSVTSGDWKITFFPKALVRGRNTSPMLDVLNHVSCSGVRKGYGSKGKTVIRVGMWGWTSPRNDIARRLVALQRQGCKIDALVNTGRMSKSTMRILLTPTKRGKIKVYNIWKDKNRNDKAEVYIHHKAVIINGRWFGSKGTKVVYTGSQNFTSLGTYANNDIVLRVTSNAVYNAYSRDFNKIRKYGKRMYVTPAVMNDAITHEKDRKAAPSIAVNGIGSDLLEDESWQYDPAG